jgi:uncharacterized protein YpmB
MLDWLKIMTIIWLLIGVIIVCVTLPYYYKKNQNRYIQAYKKEAINLIRALEDFDIWALFG